jgi:hypothetical protein
MKTPQTFAAVQDRPARIDLRAGIIFGVSVITEGVAKGHGVLVDSTTLLQVKACAETFSNGLKVKMNHAGQVGDIVGSLRNFRVEGRSLRADLHLLKNTSHRAYLMEVAESIPASFGLSISFSGSSEEKAGNKYARCTEIYSADLVDAPAANPNGLFSKDTASRLPSVGASFEALVETYRQKFGNKPEAIKYCVHTFKDAHADYLRRSSEAQAKGEIIRL